VDETSLPYYTCRDWSDSVTGSAVQKALSQIYSYSWRHHVQPSSKHSLNSSIFICCLNALNDDENVLGDAGIQLSVQAFYTSADVLKQLYLSWQPL